MTSSHVTATLSFALTFMMVAAMNPCPSGYFGDPVKECICSPSIITRYRKRKRISGPLLDRIDIHVELPRADYEKLTDDRLGGPSGDIRAPIEKVQEVQRQRFEGAQAKRKLSQCGRASHAWGGRESNPHGVLLQRVLSH